MYNPQINMRKVILTVHLEDYFQSGYLSKSIPLHYWPRFEPRLEQNVEQTLKLLDQYNCKATFFTTGWTADRFPEVIAEVVRHGHCIGSKGYLNKPLKQMTSEEFWSDLTLSRVAIEKACQRKVYGFRDSKNRFSHNDLRALKMLSEENFEYISSYRRLGSFLITPGESGYSLPVIHGNYIRQFPKFFIRQERTHSPNNDVPLVFDFHIWELDTEQPRIKTSYLNYILQYRNLSLMKERLSYYLNAYECTSIEDYLGIEYQTTSYRQKTNTALCSHDTEPTLKKEISIVIPCFNEEPALRFLCNTLQQLEEKLSYKYKIQYIFVDDGSTDKTWDLFHDIFSSWQSVKFVQHQCNQGVAAATLTGIANSNTDIVCVIDSDCTYDPIQLTDMIELLEDDVVLVTASPYHPRGTVTNVPGWRLFLSYVLSRLYRLVLRHKLYTYTSCFRVYRKSVTKNISIKHGGYLGIIEILAKLDAQGFKIVEAPATLETRLLGQSKMKVINMIWEHSLFLKNLFIMRLYHITKKQNISIANKK